MTGDDVVAWISAATLAARAVLGASGVLSHAPQAPYFGAVGGSGGNPWAQPSGWCVSVGDALWRCHPGGGSGGPRRFGSEG
jgi:hypothetical protein